MGPRIGEDGNRGKTPRQGHGATVTDRDEVHRLWGKGGPSLDKPEETGNCPEEDSENMGAFLLILGHF